LSFSGTRKHRNTLNNNTPSKKSEDKRSSDKKSKHSPTMTSSLDDQRIYDLLNTNVQKYEVQSKKETTPASPKSLTSSFPFKFRLLLQKQNKGTPEFSASAPALTIADHKLSSKSTPSTPTTPSVEESQKSPRSPKNSPRPNSPRNIPFRPPLTANQSKSSPPSTSPPVSPRSPSSSLPEGSDSQATSPRQSRRTLSFPTPRAHNPSSSTSPSSSSLTLSPNSSRGPSLAQLKGTTKSQTFLASGAASTQELHNLALEVDKMKKEVHKRLCACVETIGNTADYAQTIEISKSIRLLIKVPSYDIYKKK
jgi:hypothetical protein